MFADGEEGLGEQMGVGLDVEHILVEVEVGFEGAPGGEDDVVHLARDRLVAPGPNNWRFADAKRHVEDVLNCGQHKGDVVVLVDRLLAMRVNAVGDAALDASALARERSFEESTRLSKAPGTWMMWPRMMLSGHGLNIVASPCQVSVMVSSTRELDAQASCP